MKNLIKSKISRLLDSGNLVECENEYIWLFKGEPARLKIGRICIDARKNSILGKLCYSVEYSLVSGGILVEELTEQDYEDIRESMMISFNGVKQDQEELKQELLDKHKAEVLHYLEQ